MLYCDLRAETVELYGFHYSDPVAEEDASAGFMKLLAVEYNMPVAGERLRYAFWVQT